MHAIYDVLPSGLYKRFFSSRERNNFFQALLRFSYIARTSKDRNPFLYFDVSTVHIIQFIIQTNKYTIYMYILTIFCIS